MKCDTLVFNLQYSLLNILTCLINLLNKRKKHLEEKHQYFIEIIPYIYNVGIVTY